MKNPTDVTLNCICSGDCPITDDRHFINCPKHEYHQGYLGMIPTHEPTADLVERVARAICCEDYPCAAERDGNICVAINNWANEARAAIAAISFKD